MIFPFYFIITCESPAPKANDDLANAKFCSEMAKIKNAQAFGVRCTGWLGFIIQFLTMLSANKTKKNNYANNSS